MCTFFLCDHFTPESVFNVFNRTMCRNTIFLLNLWFPLQVFLS